MDGTSWSDKRLDWSSHEGKGVENFSWSSRNVRLSSYILNNVKIQ